MGLFSDNAAEAGLPWSGTPTVRRTEVDSVSALVWGDSPAELVLLHGGAQNAHTWDTVALALRRPLVAIDLPGHGHSAWRADHDYRPTTSAPAVSHAIETLAPNATGLVGMSPEAGEALARLRSFNHERIYLRPESVAQGRRVIEMLQALVEHLARQPDDLPDSSRNEADPLHAAVAYADGMTDRFACSTAVELLGWDPARLPRGQDVSAGPD